MAKKVKKETSKTIKYAGNVQVNLLHGDKVYKSVKGHNAGQLPLFRFLALCLIGEYTAGLRPKFIRLFGDGKIVSTTSIPYNQVSIEDGGDGESCYAELQFLIPYSSVQGASIDTLKMYCSDNFNDLEKPSVVFEFPEDEVINLSDNTTNIQIIWRMIVSNKESEE